MKSMEIKLESFDIFDLTAKFHAYVSSKFSGHIVNTQKHSHRWNELNEVWCIGFTKYKQLNLPRVLMAK